ncbi:MAG: response regulator [Desulfobacterales bacterium]
MKILIVDDEEELASTLAERLSLRGIDGRYALSGDEALRLATEEHFDVAVLDIKMPKLGGIQLKQRLQELRPGMRFLFLTGHGSDRDFEAGVTEVGEKYYLVKPLDIEQLIAKIRDLLRR